MNHQWIAKGAVRDTESSVVEINCKNWGHLDVKRREQLFPWLRSFEFITYIAAKSIVRQVEYRSSDWEYFFGITTVIFLKFSCTTLLKADSSWSTGQVDGKHSPSEIDGARLSQIFHTPLRNLKKSTQWTILFNMRFFTKVANLNYIFIIRLRWTCSFDWSISRAIQYRVL